MAFPELLQLHNLTVRDCQQPIRDDHLESISRTSCRDWILLPAHLGLSVSVADDIERTSDSQQSKRYKFLRRWKEIKGSQATYAKLIKALLAIDSRLDAEEVCKILAQSIGLNASGMLLQYGWQAIASHILLFTYVWISR